MLKKLILALLIYSAASADVFYELQSMVGWTIIDSKTIVAFKEPGQVKQSGFEGCNGETIIYFMDGSAAQCSSLGLTLDIMPTAIIFGKSMNYKGKKILLYRMLVGDQMYDIFF